MSKDIDAFVRTHLPTAQAVASKIGVDPMVLLGQWGLETGWGKSVVPGTNNLGNIKGQGVAATDNMTGSTDQYRSYPTLDAFGQDFSGLISRKYQGAMNTGPDAVAYATALKKGGYAEDPQYATKLPAAVQSVRASQGIDIDPSKIKWDAPQSNGSPDIAPQIDSSKIQWDAPSASISKQSTQASQPDDSPGSIASFGANAGKGFGKTVLGAQQLIGEGLKKVGVDQIGGWLVNDAVQGAKNLDAQAAPYSAAHPIAGVAGEITGAVANPLNRLVPMGGAGNSLINLMGRAAAQGAISGAFTPVDDGTSYWSDKAKQMAIGGAIGGATPVAVSGIASSAKYAGNALRSLVDPFTDAGQTRVAGNLLKKFVGSAPVAGNTSEIVPGSIPTLAQATGNAGLATLERGMQSSTPQGANAFAERAAQNAEARSRAFAGIAGTKADLAAAQAARASNAADDYLKTQIGIPTSNTAYSALMETPAFKAAFAQAQDMARNAGGSIETIVQPRANANLWGAIDTPRKYVSGQGLQTIKEALDDQINSAVRAGRNKQAASVLGVKDRLVAMMDNEIPGYADARAAYAQASRPIDSMKYLQGLNLTDAQGNVTLAKVQNALRNIDKMQSAPGVNEAKSVTSEQIKALTSIRDDLLRSGNSSLGKSIGSNTFQNLATNNILENALPGPVRTLMGGISGPVGNMVGRVGNWVYGGANENIQNKLLELMLQPQSGIATLQDISRNASSSQLGNNALLKRLSPYLVPAGAITGVNMVPPGK
ncbi:hypothetical protein R6138_04378 [Ralstonia thomasii]|uniref:glycoside hydrolase family 73 protein n=1 Tax=Ralstonia thomasii TaxID=3058596 RepID=UPI0028F62B7D|nr:glucosaminidase domain-containing protein [Ralstonia sp. LMG 18095]CAJ0899830.1 hypothetical protein R6138_04378 [Ralstonia sp. LMG 18095]